MRKYATLIFFIPVLMQPGPRTPDPQFNTSGR